MHDEDIHQGYQPDEAGRRLRRPNEDEDAEGHVFAARTGEAPDAGDDPGYRARRPDAGDDVEGHVKAKRSGEAAPEDDEGGEGYVRA